MRRQTTTALALAACAALGACGGTTASTTAARPAATAAAPASVSGSTIVTIKGFAYRPQTVTVGRGTRVTWVNRDAANHTVTFHHGPELGNLNRRQRKSAVFRTRGTFAYVCQYHPFMKGRVIVR